MEPEQKSNGALVGLIVIIIILVLGGIYLWKNSMIERQKIENVTPVAETTNTGETTDDTAELEANVNSIDLDSLDNGI